MTSRVPRVLVLLFAGLGLLGTGVSRAAEPHQRVEIVRRELVLGPEVREVIVANTFGAVTVRAGEPGRVSFAIRQTARSYRRESLEDAFLEITLDVDEETTRLELMQAGPFTCVSDGGEFRGCGFDPDYEVSWDWEVLVPAGIDVEASNVNGGPLAIEGVTGRVKARNVNGAVRLEGLAGAVEASTVNGDLHAVMVRAPTGDSSFETLNGDVELVLPADTSAELGLRTRHGEIYTDFEFTTLPRRPTPTNGLASRYQYRLDPDLLVRIGAGGVRLYCGTLNGDIVVRAR